MLARATKILKCGEEMFVRQPPSTGLGAESMEDMIEALEVEDENGNTTKPSTRPRAKCRGVLCLTQIDSRGADRVKGIRTEAIKKPSGRFDLPQDE
jgi:hypothetical protein